MPVRVSVVIPTYNRSRLVCEAVESVLAQGCDGVEILVIDDGSTDDTAAALQRYGDRIRYFFQSNQGVNAARNRAIAESCGEYVALLDSDDLWLPFKLEIQMRILDRLPQAGFLFSDFSILRPDGARLPGGLSTWHQQRRSWNELYEKSFALSAILEGNGVGLSENSARVYFGDIYHSSLIEPYVLPSTALVRRRCLDADLRFVERDSTCGDWEFFARLSHRHGAAFLDLETTLNRSHEDEVRLTRVSATIQTSRRVGMIERVWMADVDFLRGHMEEVEQVLGDALLKLTKLSLFDGDSNGARCALRRLACLSTRCRGWQERVLGAAAWLPGAKHMMRLSRRVLRVLR